MNMNINSLRSTINSRLEFNLHFELYEGTNMLQYPLFFELRIKTEEDILNTLDRSLNLKLNEN